MQEVIDRMSIAKLQAEVCRMRSVMAYCVGRLDLVPQTAEGWLCIEVKDILERCLRGESVEF